MELQEFLERIVCARPMSYLLRIALYLPSQLNSPHWAEIVLEHIGFGL